MSQWNNGDMLTQNLKMSMEAEELIHQALRMLVSRPAFSSYHTFDKISLLERHATFEVWIKI